jgi:hypothetical protein
MNIAHKFQQETNDHAFWASGRVLLNFNKKQMIMPFGLQEESFL